MKFKPIPSENPEDTRPAIRMMMNRRQAKTLAAVAATTIRRSFHPIKEGWYDGKVTGMDVEFFRGVLGSICLGVFRSSAVVSPDTKLEELGWELEDYAVVGVTHELEYNPTTAPLHLVKVARLAGRMATEMDAYYADTIEPRVEAEEAVLKARRGY